MFIHINRDNIFLIHSQGNRSLRQIWREVVLNIQMESIFLIHLKGKRLSINIQKCSVFRYTVTGIVFFSYTSREIAFFDKYKQESCFRYTLTWIVIFWYSYREINPFDKYREELCLYTLTGIIFFSYTLRGIVFYDKYRDESCLNKDKIHINRDSIFLIQFQGNYLFR